MATGSSILARRIPWLVTSAAAAATKSLQSCPTLYDPMDCSLPGSSVCGILQARILEWVAIPFSKGSSQPGIEPRSPALQADSLPSESRSSTERALILTFSPKSFLKAISSDHSFLAHSGIPAPHTQLLSGE